MYKELTCGAKPSKASTALLLTAQPFLVGNDSAEVARCLGFISK